MSSRCRVTKLSIPCFQNDPRDLLQLSRYACHNILLSFAVVNKVGRSSFSPSANLTVSGGMYRLSYQIYLVELIGNHSGTLHFETKLIQRILLLKFHKK